MNWGNYLFSFDGRINRAKIWLFVLIAIVAYVVFGLALNFAFGASLFAYLMVIASRPADLVSSGMPLAVVLFGLFYLFMLYIALAVTAKRLHDRNKSAMWLLLFIILPLVLNIAGAIVAPTNLSTGIPNTNPIRMVFSLVSFVISIWGFVELYCLRGTVGENRFGPDPLPPPTA